MTVAVERRQHRAAGGLAAAASLVLELGGAGGVDGNAASAEQQPAQTDAGSAITVVAVAFVEDGAEELSARHPVAGLEARGQGCTVARRAGIASAPLPLGHTGGVGLLGKPPA